MSNLLHTYILHTIFTMVQDHLDNMPGFIKCESKHHIVALKMRNHPPPVMPGKEAFS
jgi:hypothetical protein